jgi:nicotinamidase-related amidase
MSDASPLPYGPLNERTIHLCIDMQRLFAEETPWHTPWMERVLPIVVKIAEAHPEQTIFTRFIPPRHPDEMRGAWRRFYRRWAELTLERIDPGLLELVAPLARLLPPAITIDKRVYSPFSEQAIWQVLRERHADTLVITGAETDMCVLAAVMDAVDYGFRVVLATDAICSSSDRTHDALMTLYCHRFSEQIETVTSEAIISAWPRR